MAKKIKNGARKIVLEKAEEARDAAFSAFKALGVDVPQFPMNITKKEPVMSSREDTTSSEGRTSNFVHMDQNNLKSKTIEVREDKTSDVGSGTSPQHNSDDTTLSISGAGPSVGIISMKENTLDETVPQKEEEKEGLRVGNKERNSEKGPMSAVNAPGGFDTFLNMWDAVNEFFFDIHYNKRSELHTIAPFELQGIAICWEDSPVYYISVPKDLYWSEGNKNKSPIGNNNFRAQQDQLEMAKKRWCRICMIMSKNHVRKFGWNLKIQNQVLKHPAVSIQRFGSIKDSVKTMGVELIENSYYMFSPVHLKDVVDLCVVVWILWPDEERSSNPNLEKVAL